VTTSVVQRVEGPATNNDATGKRIQRSAVDRAQQATRTKRTVSRVRTPVGAASAAPKAASLSTHLAQARRDLPLLLDNAVEFLLDGFRLHK
jgi:hypothetical protein